MNTNVRGPAPGRLPVLDGLRFLAALSVLAFHYGYRGALGGLYLKQGYPELAPVARFGDLGVHLFFLISGFVILLTVEAGKGLPSHFIASRVSRLYPVFWVAATLTTVLMIGQSEPLAVTLQQYLASLTMVPTRLHVVPVDMVYWTLAVELQFYLFVVLYLIFLQRLASIDTMLVLWLLATVCLLPFPDRFPHIELLVLVPYSTFFIAGGLFYRAMRDGFTRSRVALLAVCWVCAMVTIHRQFVTDPRSAGNAELVWLYMLAGTLCFAAIATLSVHPDWMGKYAKGMAFLGALTYPLYLVHQKIGYVSINALAPRIGRWWALGITIVAVLVLAWLLHRLIEVPFNGRFRRWLEPRLRRADRILPPRQPERAP